MSTNDQAVKVSYGKINLLNSGGTLGSWRVSAPFVRATAAQTGTRIGQNAYTNASMHAAVGGGFTTTNVSHPEGTILMLQASRTRRSLRVADGCIFLRLRPQAALLCIKMRLPTGPDSILGEYHIAFTGCADIMSAEELVSVDVVVPYNWQQNYMNVEEIDQLFDIEELRPAVAQAPQLVRIASSQGVQLRAVADEPMRRLRLRKP